MAIVAYRKYSNAQAGCTLRLPDGGNGLKAGRELCTIEGVAYVVLPDEAVLPTEQPDGIVPLPVTLTPALLDQFKTVSAQARFIGSVIDAAGPKN